MTHIFGGLFGISLWTFLSQNFAFIGVDSFPWFLLAFGWRSFTIFYLESLIWWFSTHFGLCTKIFQEYFLEFMAHVFGDLLWEGLPLWGFGKFGYIFLKHWFSFLFNELRNSFLQIFIEIVLDIFVFQKLGQLLEESLVIAMHPLLMKF